MLSARLRLRLLRHHGPLAIISILGTGALYFTRPYTQVIPRLAFATAYPALLWLSLTLLIGPWKIFLGNRMQVSFDLRRDIGIWAGIMGLIHTAAGQFVHMAGQFWLYYIYENWQQTHFQPFRHDTFGFSNETGLIAAFILFTLLATSNDASLRWLKTPGWKSLQRWNYACFALTAAHALGYQLGIGGGPGWFLAFSVTAILVTFAVQLTGWRRRSAAGHVRS
jgi:sulfoxide reductase heme-binding subunit YedZ